MSGKDPSPIKVKKEKIDPEIEHKIKDIEVKVEKHWYNTPEDTKSITAEEGSEVSSDTDDSGTTEDAGENLVGNEEKKNIEPVKSSNEILSELFRVFNAALPEELLNDEDLLKKSHKQKKRKKGKRKKRKRSKSDGAASVTDGSEEDAVDGEKTTDVKHKHKKKRKHKHKENKDKDKEKKQSKAKHKDKERNQKSEKDINYIAPAIKRETTEYHSDIRQRKRHTLEDSENAETLKKSRSRDHSRETEHRHGNSFYNGVQEHDSRRDSDYRERRSNVKIKSESVDRRVPSHSRDTSKEEREMSEISLSDEETFWKERDRERTHGNSWRRRPVLEKGRFRTTNSFYAGVERNRSRDRDRQRYHDDSTRRRSPHRTRSRSRSRARELGIDKKRLLEIARKNAISMFKRGGLPGCNDMSEEVKDKVLLKMRYGGRTVQDLTDFCKKISNGELLSDLSSDEDTEVDKSGKAQVFHHPFMIREREPIVMHIRNSMAITPRVSDDKTKAITMLFPVSSGQQHRKSETWVPVPEKVAPLPPLPPVIQGTTIFKNMTKNVFEKSIPAEEQQEPAFKQAVVAPSSTTDADATEAAATTTVASISLPDPSSSLSLPTDTPMPSSAAFVPDVPVPSTTLATSDSVFSQEETTSFDVSSIISKRLNAMRRLQENPMDSEAIKMMYNSQREMTSWAKTKHLPGQFTGSTGANVLRPNELNSGPQIWARRDQLTSTQPVTSGMGMQLLQKMGWKPGEGLGRQKTGALQPLLLDVKLDKRGLISKEDTGNRRPQLAKKRGPNSIAQAQQDIQNKHPVCLLNELASKQKWTPPVYTVINEAGPAHNKLFLFSVQVNDQTYTPDRASNTKKEAKLVAARHCLQKIGFLPPQ